MANSIVGDDVYGEDPTINALEERCAKLFKKEAGIFVCSGTMGNLLAVLSHCQRGEEIIVGKQSHIHRWEQGNYAQFGGVSAMTVEIANDGTLPLKEIEASIRGGDSHLPTTKLICLENTHNWAGGKALSREYLRSVRELADHHKLKVHLDGARVYNAAVATGMDVSEIASYVDSIQMCFSKGLGSPVGSIVVGEKKFIDLVRHKRKAVGGGWRQAGILAAAAMYSLDHAIKTVTRDNKNANGYSGKGFNDRTPNHLKEALHANEEGLTNIVVVRCANGVTPSQMVSFFQERRVLFMVFDDHRVRLVTNWGLTDEHIPIIFEVYEEFIKTLH
ncbi:unnamed protein product, partial [Mesorhabditis belari]|uniref:Aromatic amino acid beta-eliminating lyase/threonine aldolase domain-containing protein n=1 Tax=Mesorhabditis belari TaxID=2138241 RepID=A0AAF3FM05_9BILA